MPDQQGVDVSDWLQYRRAVLDQLSELKVGLASQETSLTALRIEFARIETRIAVWSAVIMFVSTIAASVMVKWVLR